MATATQVQQPPKAPSITTEELDAYNVHMRQLGAEAVRLANRKDAACAAIYAAKGFIPKRFATARHLIAVERCDTAFNLRVWGRDPGQAERRKALVEHIATIRRQIVRSRVERAEREALDLRLVQSVHLMAAE